jgi:hypothetical protein
MNNELLQCPAVIETIRTLVDGGLKITLDTPELTATDITTLMQLKNKAGYFVFKLSQLIEEDILTIPEEPIEKFKKNKSQSERIYNTLFVYWKQQGSKGEFADFYKKATEKYINSIKDKLEPEND